MVKHYVWSAYAPVRVAADGVRCVGCQELLEPLRPLDSANVSTKHDREEYGDCSCPLDGTMSGVYEVE